MSERLTNILGYLTLAAILAAIWILFGEDPARDQGARGEPTFAGLAERINESAKISIAKEGEVVTLVKSEGNWGIAERSGYPANLAKVRAFLRGFALSERREPKTSNSERFDRLELGTSAINVTLSDDSGSMLMSVQVGTRKESNNGRSLTYVFQPSDTRAWLVTGIEDASVDPVAWIDDALLNIAERRINRVTLNDAVLSRTMGENEYLLEATPADTALVPAWQRSDPARVVTNLRAVDVQKVNNPLAEPTATATLRTYDGLILRLTLLDYQGDSWAQLSADFDASARGTGDAGILVGAPEDGAAEAVDINARTQGWLFKINEAAARPLKQRRADFLETAETNDTPP